MPFFFEIVIYFLTMFNIFIFLITRLQFFL